MKKTKTRKKGTSTHQEVLGDVDGHLVEEGGRDVEAILNVVQGARCNKNITQDQSGPHDNGVEAILNAV
jgi:hypothetical protein